MPLHVLGTARAGTGFLQATFTKISAVFNLLKTSRCGSNSGIADPFNGHIDAFRIAHVQRSDGWIATTWNKHERH